jgi:hypothetical protein
VRGGIHAKFRNGEYATLAPDGYRNVERRVDDPSRSRIGRYERWIEPDPEQFKVWRLAWDLLLTAGRPFIEIKNNRRKPATNSLSKRFHNWVYAGWVVSKRAGNAPKTMRGHWKPVVTTEEFERGLEILTYRDRHRVAKRRHVYLLKGLVYIEDAHTDKLIKLTGSTSNSRRKGGGTAYYCVWSSDINIRCDVVEGYVAEMMSEIQVDPDLIPVINEAYTTEIAVRWDAGVPANSRN